MLIVKNPKTSSRLNNDFLISLCFLVTLIGGVVFILFAITSSIWDPNSEDSPALPAGGNWDEEPKVDDFQTTISKVFFSETMRNETRIF